MAIDLDYSDSGSDWLRRRRSSASSAAIGPWRARGAGGLERVVEDADSAPLVAFCPACWRLEVGQRN